MIVLCENLDLLDAPRKVYRVVRFVLTSQSCRANFPIQLARRQIPKFLCAQTDATGVDEETSEVDDAWDAV